MMSNEQNEQKWDADQSVFYQIRIKGQLGQQWTEWFGGLTLSLEEDDNTLLAGFVVDQSALYGILRKIRDLGITLLSVNYGDSNLSNNTEMD